MLKTLQQTPPPFPRLELKTLCHDFFRRIKIFGTIDYCGVLQNEHIRENWPVETKIV